MAGDIGSLSYGDRVCFDSVRGIAGTEWPVGTPQLPSDVIADIITICAARNIHKIDVEGALTLGAAMQHYCFGGNYHESIADTLDLNGQDVDNSRFERLVITGAQAGAGFATYIDCLLYNMSGLRGMAKRCAIYGTLAVATGNTDFADFDHCTSVHGQITVTIGSPDRVSFKDFSGGMILTAQAAGAVLVRGIKGYLEVDLMTGGTLDIYADAADIQINADCTVGTINIFGNARVVNNTGGTLVNDYTLEGRTKGQDDIHDDVAGLITSFKQEAVAATDVNGTTWKDLLDKSTITKPTKICGFKVTKGGTWAGNAKVRITDGAGNKIFPFQDEYVEGTDFADAAQAVFNFPVVVPVADGYKFQFRSSNAADGAGETLTLNNLDVIEVG